MKNTYVKPILTIFALEAADVISASSDEVKEIAYFEIGGMSDVVPY